MTVLVVSPTWGLEIGQELVDFGVSEDAKISVTYRVHAR